MGWRPLNRLQDSTSAYSMRPRVSCSVAPALFVLGERCSRTAAEGSEGPSGQRRRQHRSLAIREHIRVEGGHQPRNHRRRIMSPIRGQRRRRGLWHPSSHGSDEFYRRCFPRGDVRRLWGFHRWGFHRNRISSRQRRQELRRWGFDRRRFRSKGRGQTRRDPR